MFFRPISNITFFDYSVIFCLCIFSSVCFHSVASPQPEPLNNPIFYESAPGMFVVQSSSFDDGVVLDGNLPSGLRFSSSGEFAIISGTPDEGTKGTYPITLSFDNETTQEYTLSVFYEEPPSPLKGDVEIQKNMNFIARKYLTGLGCVGGGKNPIAGKSKHCINEKIIILRWKIPKESAHKVPIIGFRIFSDSKLQELVAIVPNKETKRHKFRLLDGNFKNKQFSIVSVNALGVFSEPTIFKQRKKIKL